MNFSFALASDGMIYSFGYNAVGQLGDGQFVNRLSPVKVIRGSYVGTNKLGDNSANPVVCLSAGFENSIGITADGYVFAFGRNNFGQLGDNSLINKNFPIRVYDVDTILYLNVLNNRKRLLQEQFRPIELPLLPRN